MLPEVILYAYTQRNYSSRQIARAVRENVMFMWIAGRQRPDFRTLSRFRSKRVIDVFEAVFSAVLKFLVEVNYQRQSKGFRRVRIYCRFTVTLLHDPGPRLPAFLEIFQMGVL